MTDKQASQMSVTRYTACPFICLKIPFICVVKPLILPFVCIKQPLVGNKRFLGFTMIELLITLAVAAILAFIALPSFQTFMKNNRLRTQTSEIVAALSVARSEAIKRKAPISVCIRDAADNTQCIAGSEWRTGWIVFVDDNGDGDPDGGEDRLRVQQSYSNVSTITVAGFAATNYVQYRPDGRVLGGGGSFTVCDDRSGNYGRIVTVRVTGRPTISSTSANCP